MISESAPKTSFDKSSLIIEIMGPAGAGKTTITKALKQLNNKFQLDFHFSKVRKIPYFISNTYTFLPTYLRQYRQSRWFTWRETRSMVYLNVGLYVLEQQPSNDVAILLDHGPIYRLSYLREFGPEITNSQLYKRWWNNLLYQWIDTLDMIIMLDAPNDILLKRIRERDRMHAIKEIREQEANEFLNRYRASFEQTISESGSDSRVAIYQFDTNQDSISQIMDEVLVACDSVRLKT